MDLLGRCPRLLPVLLVMLAFPTVETGGRRKGEREKEGG